jgi:hypothetical protein
MVHRLISIVVFHLSYALLCHNVSFKKAVSGYCVCPSTRMQKLKSFIERVPAFNTYRMRTTGGKGRTSNR